MCSNVAFRRLILGLKCTNINFMLSANYSAMFYAKSLSVQIRVTRKISYNVTNLAQFCNAWHFTHSIYRRYIIGNIRHGLLAKNKLYFFDGVFSIHKTYK